MFPYALCFLFHYIQEVEREGIPQPDLLLIAGWGQQPEFLEHIACIWKFIDPHNSQTPMGWPFFDITPLHILVALGSRSAFDAFLQEVDVEADGRDLDGNTPLLLAIREGY